MIGVHAIRGLIRPVALGCAGIAVVTAICFPLHLEYAMPGFLYLLVVVTLAPSAGFAASAIVSVAAATCLNYFFTPPILKLEIADPRDIVAVSAYLLSSLIITRPAHPTHQ